jgi:excisionase family DNA binding protein
LTTDAIPDEQWLTTGEAANLCSVARDTVLKWINAKKLPSKQTPGGHHRVPRSALLPLINKRPQATTPEPKTKSIQFCWEYHSEDGKIKGDCLSCVVYRSKTHRCYELAELPVEAGHARTHCLTSCEECEYYALVAGQPVNVLVVSEDKAFQTGMAGQLEAARGEIRFAADEYGCAALIADYRPDFVIVDCAIGPRRCRSLATRLLEDPRIPLVRVILVGDPKELPARPGKSVFACVGRQSTDGLLSTLTANFRT